MKRVKLNSQQIGLLTSALLKNLFPKPDSGELFNSTLDTEESMNFYFENSYFERLTKEIRTHFEKGSFSRSNNERDWNDLMNAINLGEDVTDDKELVNLEIHFLAK